MTNTLENISFEDIENKLMLTLLRYPDKTFTKTELYNLLLENFDISNKFIHPDFKFKYMIVLNQLPSKYDVKMKDSLITCSSEINPMVSELKVPHIQLPTMENVSEFIVENKLLKLIDLNNIPFDLVNGNKVLSVEKLFDEEPFLYFKKKNTENKTALRYINSQEMTNLFLEKLYLKMLNQEKENLELHDKIQKLEERTKEKFELFNKTKGSELIINICSIIMLLTSDIRTILFANLCINFIQFIYVKIYNK